ncbi:hypothetical protein L0Y40_00295 [Candidatus Wolfebacteria bacterium]|nr:hypothetical protein [Candidatus Wolfebacteria bacterium]
MKKTTMILGVFFALMTATAYGQETGARDERGLRFQLKPAKFQVFVGVGEVIIDGDTVAETQIGGIATIHPIGKKFFLRPYLSVGTIDPEKAGAESFEAVQGGALVGYKVSKRFTVLAGGSVTMLFLDKETEYRPTLNVATATTIKKFESGTLQLLTPISVNQTPNGDWSTVAVVGIGFVF